MLNWQTVKIIASATIVITAICIMLPGVMGYAFSLARLGLIILIAIVVSSALAFTIQFLLKRKQSSALPLASNAVDKEVS